MLPSQATNITYLTLGKIICKRFENRLGKGHVSPPEGYIVPRKVLMPPLVGSAILL